MIADREPARIAAAQAMSEGGDESLQQPPMPAEATLHRIGDDTRMRPLLLVDEAQETPDAVFAGDNRLLARLRRPDLKPFASRMRQRLVMAPAEPDELAQLLEQAGNPRLMTTGLKDTLVAHAAGNPRALTVMADGLLAAAAEHDREILDEKLFIETWSEPAQPTGTRR